MEELKRFANKLCPKCGESLWESDLPEYSYVCFDCDENFYEFEVETIDVFDEWCPYCKCENEFPNEFKPHRCKGCGRQLLPCSLCTDEVCETCETCPFQVWINGLQYTIISIEEWDSLFDITDNLHRGEAHHWYDKWIYKAHNGKCYACYKEDTSNCWKL